MYKEHSLFPRNHKELAVTAYKVVLQTLEKERSTRRHVFKLDPAKRQRKVGEMDTAIAELKTLYRLAVDNLRK